MAVLIVEAKVEKLDEVIDFVNEQIVEICTDPVEKAMLDIAVEEIFVNIATYAYEENEDGNALIRVEVQHDKKQVVFEFVDAGIPYNPLEKSDPDITLDLEERSVGGLGIFIVKESMDKVSYEYKDNKNHLTVIKKIKS